MGVDHHILFKFYDERCAGFSGSGQVDFLHRRRFFPSQHAVAVFSSVVQDRVAEGSVHPGLLGEQPDNIDVAAPVRHAVHLLQADHFRVDSEDQFSDAFDIDCVVHSPAVVDVVTHDPAGVFPLGKSVALLQRNGLCPAVKEGEEEDQ